MASGAEKGGDMTGSRIQTLRNWWRSREQREKRLLVVAGLLVAGATLWTAADNIDHERTRIAKALPRAEAQLTQLRHDAARYAALVAAGSGKGAWAALTPELVTLRLGSAGVVGELLREGTGFRFRGEVGFDAWVNAVAMLHKEMGLRVIQLRVTRLAAGRVRVDAALAAPGS